MLKTELPSDIQHKSVSVTGVKILNDAEGIVEAFVAGIGNKDSVGDIIQPGAFKNSLNRRKPKGIWSHDWDRPVSKTLEIYEVEAGDPRLPPKMKLAGIGGLYVKTQFNLDSFDGREAYSWVKFYDDEGEWSIGYVPEVQEYDKDQKANLLHSIDLFEYSPVLFGANSLTSTVGVKVLNTEEENVTVKIQGIEDDALRSKAEQMLAELIDDKSDSEVDDETVEVDTEVKAEEAGEEPVVAEDSQETVEKSESEEADVVADEVEVDEKAETEEVVEEKPWHVEERDGEFCVIKDDDGSVESCHKTEDEANDHMAALYASEDSSDDEGEKSAEDSQNVKFFAGALASVDLTDVEGEAIKAIVDSRTSIETQEKVVPGSMEQRMSAISMMLREEFSKQGSWVWPVATFESSVVFVLEEYVDGVGYQERYLEVGYSVDEDGYKTTGEATEVDLVEVIVAKRAVIEAAFKGHAALLKSVLKPLVDASSEADVEGDVEVKSAMDLAAETKAGRSLSTKNRDLLESAKSAIESVLGSESVEEEVDEKSIELDEEAIEVEASEGSDLEVKDAETEVATSDVVTIDLSEFNDFQAILEEVEDLS